MPPPTVGPRASIKLSGTVLRGHPFSGAAAASGAGCSGAVAAPLPCGPVPALKLRHCHTPTLPRGASAPATCRQPSSSAVRSGGVRALAEPPAVAKICKVRRSRQVCHWGRLPMRSGGLPYAGAVSHALWHFPYVFAASHAIPRPPIHRPSPHTVSRFPHTATRLMHFPIRFGRSP